jgi:type IV secretory pathway VirB10-like protein
MAERPGIPNGRSRVSILAERFGMTNEEVEELLRSTREEYSAPSTPLPEAVYQPIPPTASVNTSTSSAHRQPVSGIFLAVLFTALLIALGIALSLKHGWFQQRADRQIAAQHIDTIHKLPKAAELASKLPEKTSDSVSDEVPPDMLAEAREKHPVAPVPAPPRRIKSNAQPERATTKPALTTSSNFEAEEHLAELRADGNDKAHIKTTRKGGNVKYQVFTK